MGLVLVMMLAQGPRMGSARSSRLQLASALCSPPRPRHPSHSPLARAHPALPLVQGQPHLSPRRSRLGPPLSATARGMPKRSQQLLHQRQQCPSRPALCSGAAQAQLLQRTGGRPLGLAPASGPVQRVLCPTAAATPQGGPRMSGPRLPMTTRHRQGLAAPVLAHPLAAPGCGLRAAARAKARHRHSGQQVGSPRLQRHHPLFPTFPQLTPAPPTAGEGLGLAAQVGRAPHPPNPVWPAQVGRPLLLPTLRLASHGFPVQGMRLQRQPAPAVRRRRAARPGTPTVEAAALRRARLPSGRTRAMLSTQHSATRRWVGWGLGRGERCAYSSCLRNINRIAVNFLRFSGFCRSHHAPGLPVLLVPCRRRPRTRMRSLRWHPRARPLPRRQRCCTATVRAHASW